MDSSEMFPFSIPSGVLQVLILGTVNPVKCDQTIKSDIFRGKQRRENEGRDQSSDRSSKTDQLAK